VSAKRRKRSLGVIFPAAAFVCIEKIGTLCCNKGFCSVEKAWDRSLKDKVTK